MIHFTTPQLLMPQIKEKTMFNFVLSFICSNFAHNYGNKENRTDILRGL